MRGSQRRFGNERLGFGNPLRFHLGLELLLSFEELPLQDLSLLFFLLDLVKLILQAELKVALPTVLLFGDQAQENPRPKAEDQKRL
jgi:hypothetical protein